MNHMKKILEAKGADSSEIAEVLKELTEGAFESEFYDFKFESDDGNVISFSIQLSNDHPKSHPSKRLTEACNGKKQKEEVKEAKLSANPCCVHCGGRGVKKGFITIHGEKHQRLLCSECKKYYRVEIESTQPKKEPKKEAVSEEDSDFKPATSKERPNCPKCGGRGVKSGVVTIRGKKQQRYQCKGCGKQYYADEIDALLSSPSKFNGSAPVKRKKIPLNSNFAEGFEEKKNKKKKDGIEEYFAEEAATAEDEE